MNPARPTTEDLWKRFVLFAIPLVLGNVLQAMSGTLNTIYAGRLLGVTSYAAIAVVTPVLVFLSAFVLGFGSGVSILAGQAWGAKNLSRLREIAGSALFAGIALGVTLALVGVCTGGRVLDWMGTSNEVLQQAIRYGQVMVGSLPLVFTTIVAAALLRATGDSKTPLMVLAISSAVVLVLTPALMLGQIGLPAMGISSAAWATTTGTCIALAWLAWRLRRRNHPLAPNLALLRAMRPHPSLLWRIAKLGIPTGLFFVVGSMADLALMRFVNGFGTHATAAWGVVNQILSYVQFPGLSIAIAASVFTSQAIGRGSPEQVRAVTHTALRTSLVLSSMGALLAATLGGQILVFFTSDERVISMAKDLIWIAVPGSVILGISSVLTAVMRASGTVLWPTLISLSVLAFFLVPAGWALSQFFEVHGLRVAYPLTYLLGLVLHVGFFHFVWKKRPLKKLI